jgi:hypothetical protein
MVMKFLLAIFISLLAVTASAQPYNKPADGINLRSAQAEIPKSDSVPAGGCMPIGLTARGDLVFPMQCRELLERERGPMPEEQPRAPEQRPQQQPSVEATPIEKPKDVVATSPAQERTRKKKLSNAERRKKQALRPDIDPQTTGSTTRQ